MYYVPVHVVMIALDVHCIYMLAESAWFDYSGAPLLWTLLGPSTSG